MNELVYISKMHIQLSFLSCLDSSYLYGYSLNYMLLPRQVRGEKETQRKIKKCCSEAILDGYFIRPWSSINMKGSTADPYRTTILFSSFMTYIYHSTYL